MTGGGLANDADAASSGAHPLTVVIADDQTLVRSGFRLILKAAGIDVLAEAADGEQAVAEGVPGCTVCSRSQETPEVAAAADIVVDGPAGVVTLLGDLADALEGSG